MKLVAWLGGPEVEESDEFPGEFWCPIMSKEEFHTFVSILEEDLDDADVFIHLEVDE